VDIRSAIGQMVIVSFPGNSLNRDIEKLFQKYQVGGVIHFKENIPANSGDLKILNEKIGALALATPRGLPPFITVDEEGGRVSRLKDIIGRFQRRKSWAGRELRNCPPVIPL